VAAAAGGILVELLAAIPSVVYGLWGIFVLTRSCAPWSCRRSGPRSLDAVLSGVFYGNSLLAGR